MYIVHGLEDTLLFRYQFPIYDMDPMQFKAK